jgi:hypothetical protein
VCMLTFGGAATAYGGGRRAGVRSSRPRGGLVARRPSSKQSNAFTWKTTPPEQLLRLGTLRDFSEQRSRGLCLTGERPPEAAERLVTPPQHATAASHNYNLYRQPQ